MSYKKNKHIISPSDIIELYHEIKKVTADHGVNILNNENQFTCSQFIDLCYQHLPHSSTDLSNREYKLIQKQKSRNSINPIYLSDAYIKYESQHKNNKEYDAEGWELVK